jgi:membrane-bound ClpP family serine protease|tara:strand:- start:337 stop:540 length:204 start_codon:yes stop_codon:yes gene_type:complete
MTDDKKPLNLKISDNSFELILRILGNEFIAIKIGSTNFSGKLIAGGILLLFFTFMILEVFGLNEVMK